jgi:preprotein translocase subunit YajC
MISALSAAALGALAAPMPALAQAAAASVTAGAKVMDPSGAPVGTITSVSNGEAVVKTDKYEVRLPTTSFGARQNGFAISMTQAELNATVEAALAKGAATMTVGATVLDPAGGTVGTIEAMDGQFVTIALASGKKARLPVASVAATPKGPVIGATAAQLEAQLAPTTAPAVATDAPPTETASDAPSETAGK